MYVVVKNIKTVLRPVIMGLKCLLDTLFFLFNRGNKTTKKSILIIRLDAIGDFVLWLDAAKELRQLYPKDTHRITLIANAAWAPLAELLPYFDDVWPIDRLAFYRNMPYRWKQLRKVRNTFFDIAIQPTFSREFLLGDSLIRICGANERIGSVSDLTNIRPWQKQISDRWYTWLVPASVEPLMELERNAEFLRGLGVKDYIARIAVLPTVAQLPSELRIDESYFILFPGASWSGRQWPIEHFAKVLNTLHQRTGWLGILCGSKGERELCAAVLTASGVHAVNMAGDTSLPEFAEVVRGARLLIGNETSAVHIAAAVNTPSVCILGGGHYGRFMPYCVEGKSNPVAVINKLECFGCNWECAKIYEAGSSVPCISGVTVEQVLRASLEIVMRLIS